MSDLEYSEATLRVGGEAVLSGQEYEHGAEIYVIGRVRVTEVAFIEKDGGIKRVHKAKMNQVTIVADTEEAERFIAANGGGSVEQPSLYVAMSDEVEDGDVPLPDDDDDF